VKILITGSNGFIGKNLFYNLQFRSEYELMPYDLGNNIDELYHFLDTADFIFHLAGINRPKNESEFFEGNSGFTKIITDYLTLRNKKIPILITSSIQAEKDNPYGRSKLMAEEELLSYSQKQSVPVLIYRLPNVFGKWCRPNYNSAIATWCHNIANDLPVQISDPGVELTLVYIDDVISSFVDKLAKHEWEMGEYYHNVPIQYKASLGEIVDLIKSFRSNRSTLTIPEVGNGFKRALYSTYLSYLPENKFSYPLLQHSDDRGSFVEVLKTMGSGQISISTSKPGVIRGNHFHHTKNEKFLVVKGEAIIRFRRIDSDKIITYAVSGTMPTVVDIPTGYTHHIENIGEEEMILVLWANESFDRDNPDTYFLEV